MARILIINETLPAKLRTKLERDARKHNVLLNDRACSILCEHYGLECEESGIHYRESAELFKLRVPEQLRRAIGIDAAEIGGTIRGVALNILASHYGLAPTDIGRRPRSVA